MRPSRSGGGVPHGVNTNAPAPVLSLDGDSAITWTFTGPNPAQWASYILPFTDILNVANTYTGTSRGASTGDFNSGDAVVIMGISDDESTPQTKLSNAVNIP